MVPHGARSSGFHRAVYHKVGDEYSPDADLRAGVEDLSPLYAVGAKLAARSPSELESGL
jgi:hypothetical protein